MSHASERPDGGVGGCRSSALAGRARAHGRAPGSVSGVAAELLPKITFVNIAWKLTSLMEVAQTVLLEASPAGAQEATSTRTVVFTEKLPNLQMDNWQVTATEIIFPPGAVSAPHQHPGFVLGYVVEGGFRFQVAGQPETVYKIGQMFYEPPGARHMVAASADPAKPARILAMIFAEEGKPLVAPA